MVWGGLPGISQQNGGARSGIPDARPSVWGCLLCQESAGGPGVRLGPLGLVQGEPPSLGRCPRRGLGTKAEVGEGGMSGTGGTEAGREAAPEAGSLSEPPAQHSYCLTAAGAGVCPLLTLPQHPRQGTGQAWGPCPCASQAVPPHTPLSIPATMSLVTVRGTLSDPQNPGGRRGHQALAPNTTQLPRAGRVTEPQETHIHTAPLPMSA